MQFNLNNNEITKIYKYVDESFNMIHVIETFCSANLYTEEISNIHPIIKSVENKLDKVSAIYMNNLIN